MSICISRQVVSVRVYVVIHVGENPVMDLDWDYVIIMVGSNVEPHSDGQLLHSLCPTHDVH